MDRETYLDGLHEGVAQKSITYYPGASPETFGPPDMHSFLRAKDSGKLRQSNIRLLGEPEASIVKKYRELARGPLRALMSGAGAGGSTSTFQEIIGAESSMETLTLTPFNPQWTLRHSIDEIQQRCEHLFDPFDESKSVSMEELWADPSGRSLFTPLPEHLSPKQHVGVFPNAFPRDWTEHFHLILDVFGPAHHGRGQNVLHRLYRSLRHDGVLFAKGRVSGRKLGPVRRDLDFGDVMVTETSSCSSLFLAKKDAPILEELRRYDRLPSGDHRVQDLYYWLSTRGLSSAD